ncbi:hypothetical protein [Rhodopila sp.]|nr:hypothetical protein [Rhodopila sp.]HVZ09928.1 hypothetical protein [Rhodopila sp.]
MLPYLTVEDNLKVPQGALKVQGAQSARRPWPFIMERVHDRFPG